GWTASGARISGSTALPWGATSAASGGTATTSTTSREHEEAAMKAVNSTMRAADWLSLGAAPIFAAMATLTSILGRGAPEVLCSAMSHTSALSGMVPMYLLMSIFHVAPWL